MHLLTTRDGLPRVSWVERRIGPDGEWIAETPADSFGSQRRKSL